MPRKTETYDLESEAKRLEREVERLADKAAELAEKPDAEVNKQKLSQTLEEGHSAEQELVGVRWALEPEEDEDREAYEEVTLGGLTAGEYAQVGDYTRGVEELNQKEISEHMKAEDARRNLFAAAGVVEAPFLEDGRGKLYERYQVVCDLSPQFVFWLEQRVDELTTPNVEGNGFVARVEEKADTNEIPEPSSPSPKQS